MGCCFSTPNSKPPQNGDKHQQPHLGSHEQNCRIRFRQTVEDESVKEVLSETPISKPQQVPTLMPQTKTQLPVIQPQKVPIRKALDLEEVSLVLETCSNGESFSTTTTTATTVTENREDEATSKRSNGTRNRKRSYAVDGRDRRPKSPARKPEIPARSRPLRQREPDTARRHSGEVTVRRSRSPSRGGRSQLRPPGGIGRRVPPAKAKGVVEENDTVSVKESLENPHVSLECFIFL